jgi:hypothetical protein
MEGTMHCSARLGILLVAVLLVVGTAPGPLVAQEPPPGAARAATVSDPFYPANLDAPMLARLVDDHLAAARAAVERLLAATAERTAANTLRPFDDARNHEMIADGLVSVAIHVHPDTAVRAEGLRAQERVSGFRTELRADARVMRAFAALDSMAMPAGHLIENFLGRPFTFASWQQWVEGRR